MTYYRDLVPAPYSGVFRHVARTKIKPGDMFNFEGQEVLRLIVGHWTDVEREVTYTLVVGSDHSLMTIRNLTRGYDVVA